MFKHIDRLVYDEWLKINQREINGRTYDILYDYDAVAAIIENQFHELLLVKQFRPALMEDTIEIPAGILDDPNEENIECLLRELQEETQLVLNPESVKFILSYKPNVGFSNSKLYIYYSKVNKGDLVTGEIIDQVVRESMWLSLTELEKKIQMGEIEDVKTIVAYLCIKSGIMLSYKE